MERNSKNIEETHEIAADFIEKILKEKSPKQEREATVIALSGDLGAGKTAFTQAVGKYLGIQEKMSSPTFVIIKKYEIKKGGYKFLFHLDAYRLENEADLFKLGWEEIISNPGHLVIIEWPEQVSRAIPAGTRFVRISHDENGNRNFKLR